MDCRLALRDGLAGSRLWFAGLLFLRGGRLAEELGVPNLLLYHTEETHLAERKKLYTEEGQQYYHGNLYVPDDLETFEI